MSLKSLSVFLALFGATIAQDAQIPELKSDFKKDGTPAQWAKGHPKVWGSEDFRLEVTGFITPDEKYLVSLNQTHANFFNLDSDAKSPVHVIDFKISGGYYSPNTIIRPVPEGGYDIITNVRVNGLPYTSGFFRQRVTAEIKPTGDFIFYETGLIGALHGKGTAVTSDSHIRDLDNTNFDIKLQDPLKDIYDFSFSSDGRYLSVTGIGGAQLYNTTSGEVLFRYPVPVDFANWFGASISPDDKYVAVASDGETPLQIYLLANLDATPISIPGIERHQFVGRVEWSPDSKFIATSDNGRLRIWSIPEGKVVNYWEAVHPKAEWPNNSISVTLFGWADGGSKLLWAYRELKCMYDFNINQKWCWTLGLTDHAESTGNLQILNKRGYAVTSDGDGRTRFWKI